MAAPSTSLPVDLRARLDAEPARAVLEYLGPRLGYGSGEWRLEVVFSEGSVRRVYIVRGPVGARELEELGCREAPG